MSWRYPRRQSYHWPSILLLTLLRSGLKSGNWLGGIPKLLCSFLSRLGYSLACRESYIRSTQYTTPPPSPIKFIPSFAVVAGPRNQFQSLPDHPLSYLPDRLLGDKKARLSIDHTSDTALRASLALFCNNLAELQWTRTTVPCLTPRPLFTDCPSFPPLAFKSVSPPKLFLSSTARGESLVILEAPREILGAILVPSQHHLSTILAERPTSSQHHLHSGIDIEDSV